MALTDKLTAIADAIRSKTGSTEELTLVDMVSAIEGITGGGGSGGFNIVRGTCVPTQWSMMVKHNAGFKNYLWHAWIDEIPTDTTMTNNDSIEYLIFYVDETIAFVNGGMGLRYTPSTGGKGMSVNQGLTAYNENECRFGISYNPHKTASWHWHVISLDDYSKEAT